MSRYDDPDHTYVCQGPCHRIGDTDEHPPRRVNGEFICPDCVETCEYCGEYLDDEQFAIWGPLVRVRLPEAERRYIAGHAYCVGQWILGTMEGNPRTFDLMDYSASEIAEIYLVAMMQEMPFSQELQAALYRARVSQGVANA